MGKKQKSRAKLEAQAKRREIRRVYWYHGYYAGQVDQINGEGDQRHPHPSSSSMIEASK